MKAFYPLKHLICIEKNIMSLTYGKKYDIDALIDTRYLITNDDGYRFEYSKEYFKTESEFREIKINEILYE